jgi:hypothetical protein
MSPDTPTTFRIPDALMDALRLVRKRDGVPIAEQVRRGILLWLETKGITPDETKESRPAGKKRSVIHKSKT